MPEPFQYNPPKAPIHILYADDDILVVNKPSGLLTVPGKADTHKDCLESRLLKDYPTARIVHRLDMDTSGLVILAMNAKAHRHLGLQFERRHISKTYQALVYGLVLEEEGLITLPLRCDWPNRPKQMVDFEEGKKAETLWQRKTYNENNTHMILFPKTGRSHQLRVHMLELGNPILGDNLYANEQALNAAPRLCLHATNLSLYHPENGEIIHFQSECPF